MIQAVRRRFVQIAMLSLVATLTVLLGVVNLVNFHQTAQRADKLIALLHEYDGDFPEPSLYRIDNPSFQVTLETPFETRFFIAYLDDGDRVYDVNMESIAAFDRQTVQAYVDQVLQSGRRAGYMDQYRFGVFKEAKGRTVVVLDTFLQRQTAFTVLKISVLSGVACAAIVFCLLVVLSGKAIRPFQENIEKQRRFITDASHELKTPLTILSANTDVMEIMSGPSEWTQSNKKQLTRMNRLINSLVELSKMEEEVETAEWSVFSLSLMVREAVEAFEPFAQTQGKTIDANVQENVAMRGAEDSVYRLVTVLMDNAVRHALPNSAISVRLWRQRRHIHLSLSNLADPMDQSELPRLFDRFYRADPARFAQTGGHGIGLSTAQAIVLRHKGGIKASQDAGDGRITFSVWLPVDGRAS